MGAKEEEIIVYVKEKDMTPVVELLNFVKVNGRRNNKHMIIRAMHIEKNLRVIELDAFNSVMANHEVFKIGEKNERKFERY